MDKKWRLYYLHKIEGGAVQDRACTVEAPTIRRALEVAEQKHFARIRDKIKIRIIVYKIEQIREDETC